MQFVSQLDQISRSPAQYLPSTLIVSPPVNLPLNPAKYLPSVPALGVHRDSTMHPLQYGDIIQSPGCHFTYRIIGPCCRLFDRETLPWPACRIEWRSKEPSWRRIGKRYVVDMATRNSPSYSVEIVGQEGRRDPIEITVYAVKLSLEQREWWYSRKPVTLTQVEPPLLG